PRMTGLRQHVDVGAGGEDPVLGAGEDHDANGRMLEANPLQRVVQLDIDTEVVRVQLQSISGSKPAAFVDVERERCRRSVDVQLPVTVARWIGSEINRSVDVGRCRLIHDALPFSRSVRLYFLYVVSGFSRTKNSRMPSSASGVLNRRS